MGIARNLAKALDDYLAKEGYLEDLFSNKRSGTINPVYLPRKPLNNTKNASINETLSITNLGHDVYHATWEEHPKNKYNPDRVLF